MGDAYSQQLTASGGSGAGYSFAATGLPAGLSLTTLGLLSGTPTTAIGSPFMVDVTVTDGDGGTGSQIYTLTVKAKTIAGTIVSSLAQSYYGQEVTLTATFTATPAGSAPMTGTVAFYDGNTYLGTEPLIATGAADLQRQTRPCRGPTVSGTSSLSTSLSRRQPHHHGRLLGRCQLLHRHRRSPGLGRGDPGRDEHHAHRFDLTPGDDAHRERRRDLAGQSACRRHRLLLRRAARSSATEPVSNGVATLNVATLSAGSHSFSAVFSGGGTFSTSESSLVISTDGPRVTSVLRYGFHCQPTYLLLNFNGPLDPTSAQNPLNYQILGPGGHRITVVSAIYDSATHTVTLVPAERLNIHRRYRLTVNGTAPSGLTNPSGELLDGAGNGQAWE